jgi:ferredoxin
MTATLVLVGEYDVACAAGMTLLEASEHTAHPLDSDCGGFAACNACRVEVLEGESALTPREPAEDPFLEGPTQRLGCQARIVGARVVVRRANGM